MIIPIVPESLINAQRRMEGLIHRTPLMSSTLLNQWLGHEVIFKAEPFQKIGAFKARGALNAMLALKERNELPEKVVAFSSGNHAQAVAWAGRELGIETVIYMPRFVSEVKKQATRDYGAILIETETRMEAEAKVAEEATKGAVLIPPFDHDDVIAGQGTACLEALQDGIEPDAIFAAIGGGGWVSGTWLATQLMGVDAKVYGVEPLNANDAARSIRDKKIFRFPDSPPSIADGARTLAISERTFFYIKQIAGIYEIPEEQIMYWTQWLTHLLKISVEPTSALAMAAAFNWLKAQAQSKTALVMLSGGNIAPSSQRLIWETGFLHQPPNITAL